MRKPNKIVVQPIISKVLIFEIKLYLIKIKPITKRGIDEIIILKKRFLFLENLKISSLKKNITAIRDPKCAEKFIISSTSP